MNENLKQKKVKIVQKWFMCTYTKIKCVYEWFSVLKVINRASRVQLVVYLIELCYFS